MSNLKEISVFTVTSALPITYTVREETVAEDIIIYLCKYLKISPITVHLFGLRLSKKYWVALNSKLWDLDINKLFFRIRFKVPNSDRLRELDAQAFSYYFNQVRRDVLDNAVTGISCDKHKRELMGLGVTDMYRDILESGVTRSEVLQNYKHYIPKEISKNHFIFAKKKMDENLSIVYERGVKDVSYVKSGYLEEFEGIAKEYLIEEYAAWILESEAFKVITIKVNPYHEDMPGILYKSSDINDWQHICTIEDLCFISLKSDGSIEISRKTGIPLYITFNTISTTVSFVSLLDGYYRLSVKWTFNLCKDLTTPSLVKLKKLKCHGPVGGEFSYAKLEEKRNNKPGCYILRQSETFFDNYYLDVCTKKSYTPVTYSIVSKIDGSFFFSADKECYKSIQAIVDNYNSFSKLFCLIECLPSSEYDESNLLLCRTSEIKCTSCSTVKSQNTTYGPTQCIHVRYLQIFRGKIMDDGQEYTEMYKCLWKRNKKEKVEVALKSLKTFFHDLFLKDFLKLASDWGLLQSSSFVNLLGVTLDPISMVMEYFPMGPLDIYLQKNKKSIKEVDLVEAATYLANALWLMEEEGFVHGFIRCERVYVASHSDNSFCVRLADPGLFQNYKEFDCHWIPPEVFDYPEAAKKSLSADIWAFGTTLWEIFSYGEKPPYPERNGDVLNIRQYYKSGHRLKPPTNCPKHVYNLMEECWHPDPALRKKPQAAKRDINQFLYQVFNSRLKHPYATIMPTNKSKSSSFDTLNDVGSDALDDYSLKSVSTQLSFMSLCDDASTPHVVISSNNLSDVETVSLPDSRLNLAPQDTYDFSHVQTIIPNLEFPSSAAPLGGISSLQSIFELNDVNVVLQGKIGQGFYGEVYQGVIEDINNSGDPPKVAVKRFRNFDDNPWTNDFLREIEIMKKLKHPCIVEMKCVILEPEVNLVMEYVPHGSLKCYLKINQDRLDTHIHILKYALDVAKGMDYLGHMKIVHRDLAARNVLVADEFNVKISDFGLAQFIGPSDYYISQTNRELPIKWFAPESLRYGKFSGQSDVWSYGITLYEMFSFGEEPIIETFEESSSLLDALDKGIRLPCPKSCPNEVYVRLMLPCWNNEGKNRPLFSNIISIVEELKVNN